MNVQTLLDNRQLGEDTDREFKSAKGGVPGSLWETYSAMANTDGGLVLLGVENDGTVSGLPDPAKARKTVWDLLNNQGHVSVNLLSNAQVRVVSAGERSILVMEVPRASRRQRPVYIGQNPITGTFRRNYEGDYRCTPDEVGRMPADRAEEPADSRILERFGIDDLDPPSIQQYRQRFSARAPVHPWLSLDHQAFLARLGAWRRDRTTRQEGLTVAGLLMFGKDEAIRDVGAVPQYQVDYRERLSADPEVRWTDRVTVDGTWTANLFQFYQKVILRLFADLKVPFQLHSDMFRRDDTIVHEAIREALVNALIHADYRGQGGIVIEKHRDRISMSNPGSLLLSIEQLYQGGISECRNKSLQLMFQQIGGGEKAGSGIDKIRQGWASQNWRLPLISETTMPDRVRIILPMVSLLPSASLEKLQRLLGSEFSAFSPEEVQALVTADVEGEVTNFRLRQFSDKHSMDVTRLLQGLVSKGLLQKDGHGRGATYQLSGRAAASITPDMANEGSRHKSVSSGHKSEGSGHTKGQAPDIAPEDDPALLAIAGPARSSRRLGPELMHSIIRRLCADRFLTLRELAGVLKREPGGLQRWTLRPMSQQGQLQMKCPKALNHPEQAYRANPDWVMGMPPGDDIGRGRANRPDIAESSN